MSTPEDSPAPTFLATPTIPFIKLEADLDFNIRTEYDARELQELQDSIAAHGQNTPIKVRANGGTKFKVVEGFRRYMAFERLKWGGKPVKVDFVEFKDEAEAYLSNMIENEARAEVSGFDFAKRCYELDQGIVLKRKGPDGKLQEITVKVDKKDIAARTTKSASHVGNLIRSFKNASADVKKVWQKGFMAGGKRHEIALADIFMLSRLEDGKPLSEEEQDKALAEIIAAKEAEMEATGGKRKRRTKAQMEAAEAGGSGATPKGELRDTLELLKNRIEDDGLKGLDRAYAEGKVQGIRYALGEISRKGVTPNTYK